LDSAVHLEPPGDALELEGERFCHRGLEVGSLLIIPRCVSFGDLVARASCYFWYADLAEDHEIAILECWNGKFRDANATQARRARHRYDAYQRMKARFAFLLLY